MENKNYGYQIEVSDDDVNWVSVAKSQAHSKYSLTISLHTQDMFESSDGVVR